MRFLRKVNGCAKRDHIKNEDISDRLNICNLNDETEEYRENWRQHLNQMSSDRMPETVMVTSQKVNKMSIDRGKDEPKEQ